MLQTFNGASRGCLDMTRFIQWTTCHLLGRRYYLLCTSQLDLSVMQRECASWQPCPCNAHLSMLVLLPRQDNTNTPPPPPTPNTHLHPLFSPLAPSLTIAQIPDNAQSNRVGTSLQDKREVSHAFPAGEALGHGPCGDGPAGLAGPDVGLGLVTQVGPQILAQHFQKLHGPGWILELGTWTQ